MPNTRWVCPEDKHPSVMGPTKPRRDNIVRYCLACSQERGKLVARVAPIIEKRSQERARVAQAKAKAKAEKEKQKERAYYVAEGVDLRAELRRIWRLKAVMGKRPIPNLVVRRCREGYGRLGTASPWEYEIAINIRPGFDWADHLDTLVHEIAHMKEGSDPSQHAKWHGKNWKHTFREVAVAAYGIDHGMVPNAYHGQLAQKLRDTYDSPEAARRRERKTKETTNAE